MNISRDDAAEALSSVELADHQINTHRIYQDAAPFLMLWGAVWFVANLATELSPTNGSAAWMVGTVAGSIATALLIIWQARRRMRLGVYSRTAARRIGFGFVMLGLTIPAYFISMHQIIGPLSGRQSNAFISLFWAISYMAAGAIVGVRLFATGVVAVCAIVVGYLYIHDHYALWMAVFSGGTLMLAGLWLRRP
jgi:hypothetical protein